jgi:hypothetical protein
MDPDALESCVNVLESQPDVILAHALITEVTPAGDFLRQLDRGRDGLGAPHERFLLQTEKWHTCGEVFGVFRRRHLAMTHLIRDYTDSDRTLLGEIALMGKIQEVACARWFRCRHAQTSTSAYPHYGDRADWFNPRNQHRVVLSAWRQLTDWCLAISRAPISRGEKFRCLNGLAKQAYWRWKDYVTELGWAMRRGWKLLTQKPSLADVSERPSGRQPN